MKTFYDLLATKPLAALSVSLSLEPATYGLAEEFDGEILIGGTKVHCGRVANVAHNFTVDCPLLEPVTVKIILANKKPELLPPGKDLALIVSLTVNGYEVLPEYQREIKYSDVVTNSELPATHYLGYNGEWEFSTKLPFYQWLHQRQPWGWTI